MTDRLYFYKKSADKPPGKGIHDVVLNPANTTKYAELATVPDWRKMLDDFYVAPFVDSEGLQWNTVAHNFYAHRLTYCDPDYAWKFTLDSGDPIGKLNYKVFEHRNDCRLNKKQEAEWDLYKDEIQRRALLNKFIQHSELKDILLMTGDAELWRVGERGGAPERRHVLEEIRNTLRNPEK